MTTPPTQATVKPGGEKQISDEDLEAAHTVFWDASGGGDTREWMRAAIQALQSRGWQKVTIRVEAPRPLIFDDEAKAMTDSSGEKMLTDERLAELHTKIANAVEDDRFTLIRVGELRELLTLTSTLHRLQTPVTDGEVAFAERALTCLALELPAAVYDDAVEKIIRPLLRRLTREREDLTAVADQQSEMLEFLKRECATAELEREEARRALEKAELKGQLRGYAECRAAIAAQDGMQGWKNRIVAAFDERIDEMQRADAILSPKDEQS